MILVPIQNHTKKRHRLQEMLLNSKHHAHKNVKMRGCAIGGGGTRPITLGSDTIDLILHNLRRQHFEGITIFNPTGDDINIDPHQSDQFEPLAYRFRFFWHKYFWRINDTISINAEKENVVGSREIRHGKIKDILVVTLGGHQLPVVGVLMAKLEAMQVLGTQSVELRETVLSGRSSQQLSYWLWQNVRRPVIFYPKTGDHDNVSYSVLDFDRPYQFRQTHEKWLERRFLKIGSIIRVNSNKRDEEEWIAGKGATKRSLILQVS